MSITHISTVGVAKGSDSVVRNVDNTSGKEINIDESFATGGTDVAVAFAAVRAKIQSLFIVSDQNITLETNSGSSPGNSFSLLAGKPLMWYSGCGITINSLLAADITSLFVTNASGATALLQIRCLVDPT